MRFTTLATTLILLNTAVSTFGQATEQCRCAASSEHFYDRRSLSQIQQQQPEEGDRSLAFSNHAYNYKGYYVDDEGYYVVEGVRVLPDHDPACDGIADDDNRVSAQGSDTTPFKREGILAKVFGPGRSLSSNEHDMEEDEVQEQPSQLRSLMGMGGKGGKGGKGYDVDGSYDSGKGGKGDNGGMMGGKGDYYDDGGYSKGKGGYYGKGKGKSKGKGKGKGKGKFPEVFPCPRSPPLASPVARPVAPPMASEFPSSVPIDNIIPTCPDGSLGPLDPRKCVSVCPESGTRPSFCTDRCPNDNGPCQVICEPGSDSEPAGCIEACCPETLTDIPTSSPVLQIATTCVDGSVGPIEEDTCVDICPEDVSLEKPFGCLNACPVGAPATGFCVRVCDSGSNMIPRGCREACCPVEYCEFDGSVAPSDPDNCAVLCPGDGSFFDGCRPECPTDGSTRPANCVDVCTGAPTDAVNCEEACCFFEQPSTAPSPEPLPAPPVNEFTPVPAAVSASPSSSPMVAPDLCTDFICGNGYELVSDAATRPGNDRATCCFFSGICAGAPVGAMCSLGDIESSLIPDPSFEEFSICPNDISSLFVSTSWKQATSGTSDYFIGSPTCSDMWFRNGANQQIGSIPQNATDGDAFVGSIKTSTNTWFEYIGACLNSPLVVGAEYTFTLNLAAANDDFDFGGDTNGKTDLLCIPACGLFPIDGADYKGDDFEILSTAAPEGGLIGGGDWKTITFNFVAASNCSAIMFGPSSTQTVELAQIGSYILYDFLNLQEGTAGMCNAVGECVPVDSSPVSTPTTTTLSPTPVPIQLCPPFVQVNVSLGNGSNPNGRFQLPIEQSLLNVVNCLDPDEGEAHTQASHVWWNPGPLELVFKLGAEDESFTLTGYQFWNYFGEAYDVDSIKFLFLDKNGNRIPTTANHTFLPRLGENSDGINANNIVAEVVKLDTAVKGVSTVIGTFNSTNRQIDFQNILFLGFSS